MSDKSLLVLLAICVAGLIGIALLLKNNEDPDEDLDELDRRISRLEDEVAKKLEGRNEQADK